MVMEIDIFEGEGDRFTNSQMQRWELRRKRLQKNRQRVRSMTADEAERLRLSTIHETSAEEARERFESLKANR